MADRLQGVLRASVQMSLAFRSPMTAGEIAAHLTKLNPNRPFSTGDVLTFLRSYPELFVIENRRFLGLGAPRWRLTPTAATAPRQPHVGTPPAIQDGAHDRPPAAPQPPPPPPQAVLRVVQNALQDDLELIEEEVSAGEDRVPVSAEQRALAEERARRRTRRGRAPAPRPGLSNYREVVDRKHPINRLSDETLNTWASNVPNDSD